MFEELEALVGHSNWRIVEVHDGEKSVFYPIVSFKGRTIRVLVKNIDGKFIYRWDSLEHAKGGIELYKLNRRDSLLKEKRKYVKVHEV